MGVNILVLIKLKRVHEDKVLVSMSPTDFMPNVDR
jgi:hypothetical protein